MAILSLSESPRRLAGWRARGAFFARAARGREAWLGLTTAESLLGGGARDAIAWDSGGGSFQITQRGGGGGMRSYVGRLGVAPARAALAEVQRERSYPRRPTVTL